jgi:signal transduction histidine kinase
MTSTVTAAAGPRASSADARRSSRRSRRLALSAPGFGRLWLTSVLLPVVCLALAGWWTWDNVMSSARGQMARTVDMVHEQVLRAMETQDAVLASMGAFIGDMDWPQIHASRAVHDFARATDLATPTVETLGAIDPQGHIAVASEAVTPPANLVLSDRDYVKAWPPGSRDGHTFISPVVVSRVDGRVQVHASRPRLGPDGRSDGGVLVSSFAPAYFERFFRNIAETPATGFALIRDDGALLARYPHPVTRSGQRVPPGDFALAALRGEVPVSAGGIGRHVHFATSGTLFTGLRVVAIRPIAQYGLTVVHRLDPKVVRADWLRQMLSPSIGAAAAMALLLLLTARAQAATARNTLELRFRTEAAEAGRAEAQQRAELEARLRQTEQVASLGQLAAGVAHDFNNLLQTIVLNGELLLHETDDRSRAHHSAALVVAASERGIALTRRMLDHTRRDPAAAPDAEAGGTAIDIAAALRAVEALMAGALGSRHRLRLDLAPDLPRARGNTAECESVLINLIANARDAMPAGGDITINAGIAPPPARLPPGRYLGVRVRDTGIGMDAATLARAEELFFTTKPTGRGSGLGLSMARGFARRNGGALDLASSPGLGTTVTLWLPVLSPHTVPHGSPGQMTRGAAGL